MADFKGYVTAAGQAFEAQAKLMGYPVIIGTIEIGDGVLPDNESPIARTNLVNKLKSFPATLELDPDNPGAYIAYCNIPADDAINGAGYFIREMGCRLAGQGAGVLFAYRRISNDFKPLITQGEAKTFIYKLRFIPNNGELQTPIINPSIVFASVQYCDNKVALELAKLDGKQSVRAATTGPIALTAAQTVDGVVLAVGDRVLVKDQADAKQNGLYLVAAQAWTRTTDADSGAKLSSGARVGVEEGTVNAGKVWYLAATGAITIGTTGLAFKDEHPDATETVPGMMKVATQDQANSGLLDNVVMTPKKTAVAVHLATQYGSALIGVPIPWPLAQMPQDIWPDIGMVFLQSGGQSFNKTLYPLLAQVHPSGVMPDLRGEVIRGWDNGRGVDVGRALLSTQLDALQNITGSYYDMTVGPNVGDGLGAFHLDVLIPAAGQLAAVGDFKQVNLSFDASRVARTATETRGHNVAFNIIARAA